MKKLKIMLLSLALFAIVGGVLAFKTKILTAYCTASVINGGSCANVLCSNLTIGAKCLSGGILRCYTTPVANQPNHCPNNCLPIPTTLCPN